MGDGTDITSDTPLVLLSGGGGGARLAAGLSQSLDERPLLVVTNTGDDFEHCGLTICPDTDSVLYAVSETIDSQRGWGRTEESWSCLRSSKTWVARIGFSWGIRTSPCTSRAPPC
jgi:LPPG:FO 2-phospho-L-lactate transferase